MSILGAIYQLFIGPLELFFEVVFAFAQRITNNPGLSIIFLSLAMNFLVLPLYRQADAMQEAERDRANAMQPLVAHIKKTFTGDERFMMLQTYYRQIGYKQTDALKGSVSLLLEIPFFIAAYHFLSNLALLRGEPLGPIVDLGAPDALISIGDITINALPILMTLINVISAAIYLKGFPIKSKIQMYGIALIFLVLLYGSPAGLVFYWTLNNIFSLIKNVFYKLKNPRLVLSVLTSAVSAILLAVVLFVHPMATIKLQIIVVLLLLLLQLPIVLRIATSQHRPFKKSSKMYDNGKPPSKQLHSSDRSFLLVCAFLALLAGLLIPSTILANSPQEFAQAAGYTSPLVFLINSFLISVGTFVIWFGIFYRLATDTGKEIFHLALWIFAGAATVNYIFFGTEYGNLSPSLQFDTSPTVTLADSLLNLLVLTVIVIAFYILWNRKINVTKVISACMCIALVAVSFFNIVNISDKIKPVAEAIASAQKQAQIPLSKQGKNIIVLMLDRAASCYLPAIMEENSSLADSFDGFTYYPNTISYATTTNYGIPGLYGGYEYIPEAMNSRPEVSLADKHNEALKVLPVLFDKAGYNVTFCDPTYAGYSWIPDLSIFDEYPNIKTYITMNGSYKVEGFENASAEGQVRDSLNRNLFCYALFKIAPVALQPTLYNKGLYNAVDLPTSLIQTRESPSKSSGVDAGFLKSFGVLDSLPNMTQIVDDQQGTFLMMSNDTTHNPTLLEEPSYLPSEYIDNTEYDSTHLNRYNGQSDNASLDTKAIHYHVNMASLVKLGEWFDFMRENGVYDNTRIILVSDHAWPLGQNADIVFNDLAAQNPETSVSDWDMSTFNCLLMVKDFNAKGFNVDNTFMTNADTPYLATEGIIQNPKNPFTGNTITTSVKTEGDQHVVYVISWDINKNNGNVFLPGRWFSVHDDISKGANWKYLGEE